MKMRTLILTAVAAIVLAACSSTPDMTNAAGYGPNPCEDAQFKALKQKQLSDMTEREYQYFLEKDRACQQYATQTAMVQEARSSYTPWLMYSLILGGAALIATIAIAASY